MARLREGQGQPLALEIAITSPSAAARAIAYGADRVELSSVLEVGGVTPSQATVEDTLATGAETHVLIRCRPGDFVYDEDEVALMGRETEAVVRAGAHGVVIGALTASGWLDLPVIQSLADRARSINPSTAITIHRCIDASDDLVRATGQLAAAPDLSPRRILTSGGRPAAGDAVATIAAMVREAGPIEVMAGGGVTIAAIPALWATGVAAVHMSAKRRRGDHYELDTEMVAAARAALSRNQTRRWT